VECPDNFVTHAWWSELRWNKISPKKFHFNRNILEYVWNIFEILIFVLAFFRTIYVPFENTVNVPAVFDVPVSSSFGYSDSPG
jgi:hypothetical protein